MSNLAHDQYDPQGQVVQFPKKERQAMSIKKDGFTGLPNFICDEGYLSALTGEAIKCLVFLNRHISGFHMESKAMGEPLVMKITGIKDKRTVRKYMSELEKYQLIEIEKSKGRSNIYILTFDNRLSVEVVASHVPSTSDVVTSNVPTLVASHVSSSSDMPCHSVKEKDLKENIKENNKNKAPSDFVAQDRGALNFIDYHSDDPKLYTLKDLFGTYPVKTDFMAQAAVSFTKLSESIISEELKKLAQWSVGQPARRSQKWMTTWLNWLSNYQPAKPRVPKTSKKSNSNLNVNDAWKNQATHHAPATGTVEIPEDFV
ncbi:hypothetical protein [Acinetobacter sp. YH12245]|uniref:hypothetical protein n=1 Tax=Acinetobacter sp. YH12245 TaxID=2601171 RepID=UPI0015D36A63|nr:hypothetical protein [Acinetobacter sp. YH12245]